MEEPHRLALETALWNDLKFETTFPAKRPLLAHYTSVSTLEKMSHSEELWLANPLYMNDWEELRFGMNTGANEFRTHPALLEACETAEAHALLLEEFNLFFNWFDSDHVMDTYVICFSEHNPSDNDGVLSMWRGYGANGGGVALVFDSSKLNAVQDSPFVVGKVTYASTSKRREWIDEKIRSIAKVVGAIDQNRANLREVAHEYIERLKLFSLFTKHDGFTEEQEWRIVYMNERDPQRLLSPMLGYAVTSKGVEPKLKVKLKELAAPFSQTLSLEFLIDRILVGPSISTLLSVKSLQRMLVIAGQSGLAERIQPSTIPFRP